MLPEERRAAFSLAAIYATRMVGLSMILPVFALYAEHLIGYTRELSGIAIGAYAMSQVLLQIPFGYWSDRFGTRPVIISGLIIFVIGSIVAATSTTMWGVIAGRAIQGGGAIAAAVMALAADLAREEQRSKVMAIIGISIGASFAVAIVCGPIIGHHWGLAGIFWLNAALGLIAIALLHWVVPKPAHVRHVRVSRALRDYLPVLADRQLLRLNGGIFILHLTLTATFTALPLALRDIAGVDPSRVWIIYAAALLGSIVVMGPVLGIAERRRLVRPIFIAAIALLAIAEIGFANSASATTMAVSLWVFFLAFNVLEAFLPSLISRFAPAAKRGTAMGVYSSAQFLGPSVGGALGGVLLGRYGEPAVFKLCVVAVLAWLAFAFGMKSPRYLDTRVLTLAAEMRSNDADVVGKLRAVGGVCEVFLVADEGIAYLKVETKMLDTVALERFGQLA